MVRKFWLRLPRLLRFTLFHFANGAAVGTTGLSFLSWLEVEWLVRLIARDTSGLAALVLVLQMAVTCGAVSMGIAAMRLGED